MSILRPTRRFRICGIVPASGGPAAAGRRLSETPNHEQRPRFSPGGKRLIWTSKATDPSQIWICDFDTDSGVLEGKPRQLATISTGADGAIWSPDGKYIAWRSQARAGFEADKERLLIYDRQLGKTRDATEAFDRSVGSMAWTPDSKGVFLIAEDHGEAPIWSLPLDAKQPTEMARLHADDLIFSKDGKALYFTRMSIAGPNEIAALIFVDPTLLNLLQRRGIDVLTPKTEPSTVTHMSDALLSKIDMQPMKAFTFKGANNDEV